MQQSGGDPATEPNPVAAARPALIVAAVVLFLESLAVAAYAVLYLMSIAVVAGGVGYGVAAMIIGWAVALGFVGWGVGRGRGWARGPAVALQLLHLPLAWGFRGTDGWLAFALFMSAAVVLVCIFLPVSTAVFNAGRRLPGERDDEKNQSR